MRENFSIPNINAIFGILSLFIVCFKESYEKHHRQGHFAQSGVWLIYKRKYVHSVFCAPQGSWFGLNLRLKGHKKASRWGRKARAAQLRSGSAYLSQLLFRAFCFFLFPLRYRFQFHAVIDLL